MSDCKNSAARNIHNERHQAPNDVTVSQSTVDVTQVTDEKEQGSSNPSNAPQTTYPSALKHAILVIALLLAQFLVALDMVRVPSMSSH